MILYGSCTDHRGPGGRNCYSETRWGIAYRLYGKWDAPLVGMKVVGDYPEIGRNPDAISPEMATGIAPKIATNLH